MHMKEMIKLINRFCFRRRLHGCTGCPCETLAGCRKMISDMSVEEILEVYERQQCCGESV